MASLVISHSCQRRRNLTPMILRYDRRFRRHMPPAAGSPACEMIDTHCHLDVAAFDADRDAVIARATATSVVGLLLPAIRPRTWDAVR
jgi:hypothetical protein